MLDRFHGMSRTSRAAVNRPMIGAAVRSSEHPGVLAGHQNVNRLAAALDNHRTPALTSRCTFANSAADRTTCPFRLALAQRYAARPTSSRASRAVRSVRSRASGEMAYAIDLGSIVRKDVGVRLPPRAPFLLEASSTGDAFEKRAVRQDPLHEKDRSTYCVRRRGRDRSAGVRNHDLARRQFRGLCPWHRMVGSGRQRVPSDRCPDEELLALGLVGSDD